ncbi:rod-binding protein [Zavarzinia sp.]|uniref:rod-binding protein n=1 Tax=Zavarzinia sp. TaxID=2027920 RepID=UPI00356395D6
MTAAPEAIRYAYPADRPLPAISPRLKAAGQDFEAMVMSEMLTPMFDGLKTDGPFGGGSGEAAFRGFLVQEFGKGIAARGGMGLSDMLIRSLLTSEEPPHA